LKHKNIKNIIIIIISRSIALLLAFAKPTDDCKSFLHFLRQPLADKFNTYLLALKAVCEKIKLSKKDAEFRNKRRATG